MHFFLFHQQRPSSTMIKAATWSTDTRSTWPNFSKFPNAACISSLQCIHYILLIQYNYKCMSSAQCKWSISSGFSSKAREVGKEPRSLLHVLGILWPQCVHQIWLFIEGHSKHNVACEHTWQQEMAHSLQKKKNIAICDLWYWVTLSTLIQSLTQIVATIHVLARFMHIST